MTRSRGQARSASVNDLVCRHQMALVLCGQTVVVSDYSLRWGAANRCAREDSENCPAHGSMTAQVSVLGGRPAGTP